MCPGLKIDLNWTEFLDAETGAPNRASRTTDVCRDQKAAKPIAQFPGQRGLSEPLRELSGSEGLDGGDRMDRDWMPTTQSIERVSGRSQEREFSMQRQGDIIGDFGTYSTAETCANQKTRDACL
jgi:hypothetical protein